MYSDFGHGTDLPYCMSYFVCNNVSMYLKTHKRKKDGKVNEYYSIVEKRKVANGSYVQKTVLYLGEISGSQKKSWNKSIKVLNEQNEPIHKTLFALHDDDDICKDVDAIPLRLSGMKLQKPRAFGDCWLGCEIWDQLGLDTFFSDRIPTEHSLAVMRESGIDYLVGTPRRLLDKFQNELIDQGWQQVNESVRVKHLEADGECYVLACSKSRMMKERAMRKRKLRKYLDGLAKLKKNYRNWQRFTKRLGVLEHEAGSCRNCVDLKLPAEGKRVTNFDFSLNHEKYRQMIYRDGMYFLRTNQTGKEAVELWQQYMLQCNVEQAFKELKSDLGVRPVYHHKEERVEAHIFVAFLSYCLQATLRQKLRNSASGLTSQAVLETLSRIQMLDVSIPTQDGRTLQMQRYTEPELEHKLILEKLNLTLPPQSPPKIYSDQVNN